MKNIVKLIKHTIKLGNIKSSHLHKLNVFICVKESYRVMHVSLTSLKTTLEILSNLFKNLKVERNDFILFVSDSEEFDSITKNIATKCKTVYLLSGQYKRGFFSNNLPVSKSISNYKPLNLPSLIIYVGCSVKSSIPLITELKKTDIIIVGLTMPENISFQCDYKLGIGGLCRQSVKFLIEFYFAFIYEAFKRANSVK